MKKKSKHPVCPQCGSLTVQYRLRADNYWCRRCGHIGKRKEFFKDEHEDSKS